MNTASMPPLNQYSENTYSGILQLGQVPRHWEVRKLRNILKSKTERNRPDLPLLSVVREKGVILRDSEEADENHNVIPEDLTNYKVVRQGQFAMNKMKAWQGSYGVSSLEGIVSPAYFIYDLRGVNVRFFHTAIRSKVYVPFFAQASDGVRIGQWDLVPARMQEIPFATPPLDEQATIVRYLDETDAKIQAYISAKERLIALLEEQRQTIIHQAVTRGLDPNVKLKSSGEEWLGDVPEHWERTRLKQVATIQAGITLGKEYKSEELIERPYLRVANVQSGHLDLSEITTVRVSQAEINKTTLQVGDVLMTEGGDIDKLGRGCMWLGEVEGCLHQNHVFAVRPNSENLNPSFLMALMETPQGRNYFYSTAKQTTNLAATNRTTLGEFPMYLPQVREQQTIVDYISAKGEEQTNAIRRTRRQIELMEEYRTRLIADVVTGKLDVRNAIPCKGG